MLVLLIPPNLQSTSCVWAVCLLGLRVGALPSDADYPVALWMLTIGYGSEGPLSPSPHACDSTPLISFSMSLPSRGEALCHPLTGPWPLCLKSLLFLAS